jgi:hypothetical protein
MSHPGCYLEEKPLTTCWPGSITPPLESYPNEETFRIYWGYPSGQPTHPTEFQGRAIQEGQAMREDSGALGLTA